MYFTHYVCKAVAKMSERMTDHWSYACFIMFLMWILFIFVSVTANMYSFCQFFLHAIEASALYIAVARRVPWYERH